MPDNKEIVAPNDRRRIDIHDPAEVRNWCKSFGCTEEEIKAAVNSAESTYAKDVQHYLQLAALTTGYKRPAKVAWPVLRAPESKCYAPHPRISNRRHKYRLHKWLDKTESEESG